MAANPFDYINSINFTKLNLMEDTPNDKLAEKDYSPFLTNRALSQHADAILYANEMNINYHLDKKLQYSYLINSVRRRKRFGKWAKKDIDLNLELVQEIYGYSYQKALQALDILTDDQLDNLRKRIEKGGVLGHASGRFSRGVTA